MSAPVHTETQQPPLAFKHTPPAYRFNSMAEARRDLRERHVAGAKRLEEVRDLVTVLQALAEGGAYAEDAGDCVSADAYLTLANRIETAVTALHEADTRLWPTVVIISDDDLLAVEHKPGAAAGVDRLDGNKGMPAPPSPGDLLVKFENLVDLQGGDFKQDGHDGRLMREIRDGLREIAKAAG